jgi:hypothetical protein
VAASGRRDKSVEMISRVFALSVLVTAGLAVPVNDDSPSQPSVSTSGKLTTSVKTTLTEGVEWLVPIEIAGKTFNVQLDTGSADL